MSEPLRRSDFSEAPDGNCRISSGLCLKLSETAPTWAKLVAPWAEFVAHSLYAGCSSRASSLCKFKTPLTQSRRREVKGAPGPKLRMPKGEHVCHGCGARTRQGQHCPKCGREISREKLIELAKVGRVIAQRPESRKKRADTLERHRDAQRAWRLGSKPAWLTENTYAERIQHQLSSITISKLASTLGVSESYAADIRAGRHRPHPRHWQALAVLVGMSEDQ